MPVTTYTGLIGALTESTYSDLDVDTYVEGPHRSEVFDTVISGQAGGVIVATWEDDLVAQFVIAAIPTARTTMYTTPVGRNAIIRWMDLVNTTGSAQTVNVWVNGVQWEAARSVAANDKYSRDTLLELSAGQLIEMQASAAGVNGFIGGVEELANP
jgi:hypothetical protein